MIVTLKSVGVDKQIEKYISSQSEEEKELVFKKIQEVKERLTQIVRVNGNKVFKVSIKEERIIYSLKENSNVLYYYPIQYAQIEFDTSL